MSPRFHVVPSSVRWGKRLRMLGVDADNSLSWDGQPSSLPAPPSPSPWLLPAKDDIAIAIATHRSLLRARGWRLLTCEEGVVRRLSDKCLFRAHASSLNLLSHLPTHYLTLQSATYPCVLKGAVGSYGRNVHIVSSPTHALELTSGWCAGEGGELKSGWLLQELIRGRVESSASLVVREGEVLHVLVTEYTFLSDAFVWPRVKEDRSRRTSHARLARAHVRVIEALLQGYSGVCNVNFKLCGDEIRIFEINTRVGGDLACDAERGAARAFFEFLDSLNEESSPPLPLLPTAPAPPPRGCLVLCPREPNPRVESRFCHGHSLSLPIWPDPPLPDAFQPALFYFPPQSPPLPLHSPPTPLPRAVVLILPGGGLTNFCKHEAHPPARHFSSLGYRTYVLAYRHAAVGGTPPDSHADTRRAIACLRERERGAMIHAIGFSAGGCLAVGASGAHADDWGDDGLATHSTHRAADDGEIDDDGGNHRNQYCEAPKDSRDCARGHRASRPDTVSYIYGAPPPGLAFDRHCPPIFLFANLGDKICGNKSCHDDVVGLLSGLGIIHRTLTWPNIWNDDEALRQLTYLHSRWAYEFQHGQGIGLIIGKYPNQEVRTWAWVAELHKWMVEMERDFWKGDCNQLDSTGVDSSGVHRGLLEERCLRDAENWKIWRLLRG